MQSKQWLEEKIYYQSKNYFADLLEAINRAQKSIEVEVYIFEDDTVGEKLFVALTAAANRGVRVRVIIDGVGSFLNISNLLNRFQANNIQVKVFHPFPVQPAEKWRWLRLDHFIQAFSQLNKRLHRKICILDQTEAFVGSFNITAEPSRDTAVRVRGDRVQALVHSFDGIWIGRKPSLGRDENAFSLLRLNDTMKWRKLYNRDLVYRIRMAEKRIWITNAYFVPPIFILKALYAAAQHGLDVRLLTPARSDHAFIRWVTRTYYRSLLISGVRVFEYHGDFLHAKTLLIDDWAMVGTSNMNHRSFFHDLEVDVILSHDSSRESLRSQFLKDLNQSQEVTLKDFRRGFFFTLIFGWILKRLKYWM